MGTISSDAFRAELELPKRTRRSGSKVRTGCLTCKVRRIKCDERKPSCSRCTSTGRKCDGYAQDTRDLQFKITVLNQLCDHPRLPMFSGLGTNVQYLEFYYHCARPTLSSHFDNEFWSRISLQMAQTEPAIRHALIALGHLHKTESGRLKDARSAAHLEHKTLLLHYNKAVRCLTDRMVEPSYTPEIGLATCVLFICIEYMRGDWATAFMHLRNGLNVITEWRRARSNDLPKFSSFPQSSPGSSNSSSTMVEETLTPIFTRSITAALLHGIPIEYVSGHLPAAYNIRHFTTILEAQSSIHELRNLAFVFFRDMGKKLFEGNIARKEDYRYQSYLLECHHSWWLSLSNLESDYHLSKEDRVTASCLKMSYYATYIHLACMMEFGQMPYDQHLESFKDLNYNAKIVLDSMGLATTSASSSAADHDSTYEDSSSPASTPAPQRPHAANFTFEISVVAPLFFCATRCRCPVTRREAISLLSLNPPREGLGDPEQAALVAKRMVEVEESEVDPATGWPVDRTRVGVLIDGNMDGNGRFSATFNNTVPPQNYSLSRDERVMVEWFVL